MVLVDSTYALGIFQHGRCGAKQTGGKDYKSGDDE